jgi:hypothetical protein
MIFCSGNGKYGIRLKKKSNKGGNAIKNEKEIALALL